MTPTPRRDDFLEPAVAAARRAHRQVLDQLGDLR